MSGSGKTSRRGNLGVLQEVPKLCAVALSVPCADKLEGQIGSLWKNERCRENDRVGDGPTAIHRAVQHSRLTVLPGSRAARAFLRFGLCMPHCRTDFPIATRHFRIGGVANGWGRLQSEKHQKQKTGAQFLPIGRRPGSRPQPSCVFPHLQERLSANAQLLYFSRSASRLSRRN